MTTARTRLGPISWPSGARATPCPLVTLLAGRWSPEQEARYAAETERLKTVVASVRAARGSWTQSRLSAAACPRINAASANVHATPCAADARIGRPLTATSVAGVHRRAYRRAVCEFELRRQDDRQVGGAGAFEDPTGVDAGLSGRRQRRIHASSTWWAALGGPLGDINPFRFTMTESDMKAA
jgi:hypothetical protein